MPAPFTAEKYVDPDSGSDSNNGNSPAAAYRTLGTASSNTSTGRQRIRCKRGTFETRPALSPYGFRIGTAVGAEFVYDTYGDADEPFRLFTAPGSDDIAWMLGGTQFVEVNDWIFDSQFRPARPFNLQSNSANITNVLFRRCKFMNGGGSGTPRSGFTADAKLAGFNIRKVTWDDCDFGYNGAHGLLRVGDVQSTDIRCKSYGNGRMDGAHGVSSLAYRDTPTSWAGGPVYSKAVANTPLQLVTTSSTYPMPAYAGATATPGAGNWGFTGGTIYLDLNGENVNSISVTYSYTTCGPNYSYLGEYYDNLAYSPYPYVEGAGWQADDFSIGFAIGCRSYNNQGPGFAFNIGANKGGATGCLAYNNGRFGMVANRATGLLIPNNALVRNARNTAGSSDNSEFNVSSGSAAAIRNLIVVTDKGYGLEVGANSASGTSLDKAFIYGATIDDVLGVTGTGVTNADPRFLSENQPWLGLHPDSPCWNAGVFITGSYDWNGKEMQPSAPPIGPFQKYGSRSNASSRSVGSRSLADRELAYRLGLAA
jgi:hypothetical protein